MDKYILTTHVLTKDYCNICESCNRILPNESLFTKNGCIWCDTKHAWKQKIIDKIDQLKSSRRVK